MSLRVLELTHLPDVYEEVEIREILDWKPPDRLFGRYEVVDVRGGGMATTYICDRLDIEQRCVLKIARMSWANWVRTPIKATRDHLASELNAWRRIRRHPYVVDLIGVELFLALVVSSTDSRYRTHTAVLGLPALVLEYGGARNLRDVIRADSLSFDVRFAILLQICEGMRHCEMCGVSPHLDLKPENILVDDHRHVRITDFGLAVALSHLDLAGGSAGASSAQTASIAGDRIVGTPLYMAPEQWRASRNLDVTTDVYAFGLIAYELLAGSHPFALAPETSLERLREAHCTETPDIGRLECNNAMSRIVQRCLGKRRQERYPSFGHLLEELHGAMGTSAGGSHTVTETGAEALARQIPYALFLDDIGELRYLTRNLGPEGYDDVAYWRAMVRVSLEDGSEIGAISACLRSRLFLNPVPLRELFRTLLKCSALIERVTLIGAALAILPPLLLSLGAVFQITFPSGAAPVVLAIWLAGFLPAVGLLAVRQTLKVRRQCPNCREALTRVRSRRGGVAGVIGDCVMKALWFCSRCHFMSGAGEKDHSIELTPGLVDRFWFLGLPCGLPRFTRGDPWPPTLRFGKGVSPG